MAATTNETSLSRRCDRLKQNGKPRNAPVALGLALLLLLSGGCGARKENVSSSAGEEAGRPAAFAEATASLIGPSVVAPGRLSAVSRRKLETSDAPRSPGTATTAPGLPSDEEAEEFRGVWLSYIELNALLKGKTAEQAGAALDKVMEDAASYGLNAVVFHVRAMSDAYYQSALFPPAAAAETLLEGGFDPLAYAVKAAHARGLQLHAWVNPYRIGVNKENAGCGDIFGASSGGAMYYYYNPASEDAQSLILRGVEEIVENYEVDGVQFDDYFYPNKPEVIPADAPAAFEKEDYAAYIKAGGALGIGDWRRAQVDVLVSGVYQRVHARKGCVFGISPDYNADKDYSSLYADVKGWTAAAGYIDYICPQIYFGFENSSAPFDRAVAAWTAYPRHSSVRLYVGLGLYKTGVSPDAYAGGGKEEWAGHSDIMKRSVELLRANNAVTGMVFYSYSSFDAATRSPASGQTYREEIGRQEVENLLYLLRN